MTKSLKFLRNWYPLILEIGIVLLCSFLIIYSENFQKKINPEKYWTQKVKNLEKGIQQDHWRVRSLEIVLQKERLVAPFQMQEAIDRAKSCGEDLDEAIVTVRNEYQQKLEDLKRNLKLSKEGLKENELKLSQAKMQLESIDR